jgi:AraC-like DNA-binding protein
LTGNPSDVLEKSDMEEISPAQWYAELTPPPGLAQSVAALWQMRVPALTETRIRILPNACVDIVIYVSDASQGEDAAAIVAPPYRSYVVGSTLRSFIVRSAGWRHVVGVSLLPAGVQAILGLPARLLGDGIVLLADVIGARAAQVEERVLSGPSEGALQRLCDVLLEFQFGRETNLLVGRAVRSVRGAQGRKRMETVASETNVSTRTLERHFLEHLGVSAKTFSRLGRFDRAARDISSRGTQSWSQFALAHGYSDQPHFINEFREFAGVTPTQFEAEATGRSPAAGATP